MRKFNIMLFVALCGWSILYGGMYCLCILEVLLGGENTTSLTQPVIVAALIPLIQLYYDKLFKKK